MRRRSYTCTEALVAKLLLCYLFANMVFNNWFYPHDASQKTHRSAGHSSKGIPSRSENTTSPAVSTTPQTRSLQHRTTDATSGVGSVHPPVKRQQRSHSTNQYSKDPAGSQPLMAQDMPTIVQAVLDALPSQTLTPVQSSDTEVVPSSGTSRDDVPSELLAS